jgi:hypothetical protein
MGKSFRVKRINNICIKGYIIYYYFITQSNKKHHYVLIFSLLHEQLLDSTSILNLDVLESS